MRTAAKTRPANASEAIDGQAGQQDSDKPKAPQTRAQVQAQIEQFKADKGITCDKIPLTEAERIAKWNAEHPGRPLSALPERETPAHEVSSPAAQTPESAGETAEHRKHTVEYRDLLFAAAISELDKYRAKHSDPAWLRRHYVRQPVRQRAAHLVARATKGDYYAWEAAYNLAAAMLEKGDRLPAELSGFAAGVLRGTIIKPKRSRSARVVTRNAAIRAVADALDELAFQHNFPPDILTRNAASPPDSICDAIAEALNKRGEHIGYAAVVKVVGKG
jgi:hypothetical protein